VDAQDLIAAHQSWKMTIGQPPRDVDNNKIRQICKIIRFYIPIKQRPEHQLLELVAKQVIESFGSASFLDKLNKTTARSQAPNVIDERRQ